MTITVTEPVAQTSITATSLPEHPNSVKKGLAQVSNYVKFILTYKEALLKVLTEDSIRCYCYGVAGSSSSYTDISYVLLVRLGEITLGLRVTKSTAASAKSNSYCTVWYGDHLDDVQVFPSGGVEWTIATWDASAVPQNTRVQVARDSESDLYYILAYDLSKGFTGSTNVAVIPFTDGEVAVLNLVGIQTMATTGSNDDHGSVYINGSFTKCVCATSVYFGSARNYSPSGTSSTSLKYVSGSLVYPLPLLNSESSVSKVLVIDPGKLGRVAFSTDLQRGVRFNNYSYLYFSGGIVIPWTGDPESVFVGDV